MPHERLSKNTGLTKSTILNTELQYNEAIDNRTVFDWGFMVLLAGVICLTTFTIRKWKQGKTVEKI